MMRNTARSRPWLACCALMALVTNAAGAQSETEAHFTIPEPAALGREEAEAIYDRIRRAMLDAHDLADDRATRRHPRWRRHSSARYRSATHGERFVNNYANDFAEDYGAFVEGSAMPAGSVLVKDAFTVTADGGVFPGPLAVMVKMEAGFSPESRDWRYYQIMPDGSIVDDRGDASDQAVAFCVACHQGAGDAFDHLFFAPEDYRAEAP